MIRWLVLIVVNLVKIPIFTLVERKVLRYIQNRKGPNKVSLIGLLQPVRDGAKLILKKLVLPQKQNFNFFFFSPILMFVVMLLSWLIVPTFKKNFIILKFSLLFYFSLASMRVFFLLSRSWARNSKYSLLGCVRGCVQTISYEICLLTLIFFPCCFNKSFSLVSFFKKKQFNLLFLIPITLIGIILRVMETNRAPFDFAEGERELVSGFKIEYGSFRFALLFLSEYGRIILIRFLMVVLFFPIVLKSHIFFCNLIIFFFLIFRGAFPRFRIDLLSSLCWTAILPTLLFFFFLIFLLLLNKLKKLLDSCSKNGENLW